MGGSMEHTERGLVPAGVLEQCGILSSGTASRVRKSRQIPSYTVGAKGRGVRFRIEEVLTALRRPAPEVTR